MAFWRTQSFAAYESLSFLIGLIVLIQSLDAQNDIWRYVKSEKAWYWMGGSNTSASPGSSGYPGARNGFASAVSNGNLWIYGGVLAYSNTVRM